MKFAAKVARIDVQTLSAADLRVLVAGARALACRAEKAVKA